MSDTLNPSDVTMTTLELTDFINNLRPSAEPIRHDNMMRKVKAYFGEADRLISEAVYLAENGEQRKCYRLKKREAVLLAGTYEYKVAAAVYDRMTLLEGHLENAANRIKALVSACKEYKHQARNYRDIYCNLIADKEADDYVKKNRKANWADIQRQTLDHARKDHIQRSECPKAEATLANEVQLLAANQRSLTDGT